MELREQLFRPTARQVIKDYSNSTYAKTETNDCVVRALAVVAELGYDVAHRIASRKMGRADRKGTTHLRLIKYLLKSTAFKPVHTHSVPAATESFILKTTQAHLWKRYAKEAGPKTEYNVKGDKVMRSMSVGTFAKKYSKGRYFLSVRNHSLAVIDGVVIGNSDDPLRLKRPVSYAFQLLEGGGEIVAQDDSLITRPVNIRIDNNV